jgi:hypothetical protein
VRWQTDLRAFSRHSIASYPGPVSCGLSRVQLPQHHRRKSFLSSCKLLPIHASLLRTKLQSQPLSVPLGKRCNRRLSTNTTTASILQPILPILQCSSGRLHPSPFQRTLKRRRGMVCSITMGEVRIQKNSSHPRHSQHPTPRLLGFGACLLGAAVCFFVAFLTLPLIALNPAKFALAFRYVLDPHASSSYQ